MSSVETLKVNITTVVSIVLASFSLYFFLSGMVASALLEAKIFTIDMDIERDQGVVEMYQFQIINNIAKPDAQGRIDALQDKIQRRIQERLDLIGG